MNTITTEKLQNNILFLWTEAVMSKRKWDGEDPVRKVDWPSKFIPVGERVAEEISINAKTRNTTVQNPKLRLLSMDILFDPHFIHFAKLQLLFFYQSLSTNPKSHVLLYEIVL